MIAAVLALAVIAATLAVFRTSIPRPVASGLRVRRLFIGVLKDSSGRMIVATSTVSGIAVFTLSTFLTATAIDEMGVGATAAAALLWVGGSVGVVSAFWFGRLGDRRTPLFAITLSMTLYSATLILLTLGWSYQLLLVALVGYGILNGPVWGLMGASANRRFDSEMAVAAVSLGLVSASILGAVANSVTGVWIEASGTMRGAVAIIAALTIGLSAYLVGAVRRDA